LREGGSTKQRVTGGEQQRASADHGSLLAATRNRVAPAGKLPPRLPAQNLVDIAMHRKAFQGARPGLPESAYSRIISIA
jgi:hypothetical protein